MLHIRPALAAIAFTLACLAAPAMAGPYEDGLAAKEAGDEARAMVLFRQGAEAGDARAQVRLADMIMIENRMTGNWQEAEVWYEKAALQGNAEGQKMLGQLVSSHDAALGHDWYMKSAAQGYAPAQVDVGSQYEFGSGVKKSVLVAEEWYLKAAAQDYAPAFHALGRIYSQGGPGLAPSTDKAREWYEKSAAAGNKNAVQALKMMDARSGG